MRPLQSVRRPRPAEVQLVGRLGASVLTSVFSAVKEDRQRLGWAGCGEQAQKKKGCEISVSKNTNNPAMT